MDQHPGEPNKQARSRPEAPVPDTSTVYAAKTDSVYRPPSSPSGTPCVPALLSLKGYHSELVGDVKNHRREGHGVSALLHLRCRSEKWGLY